MPKTLLESGLPTQQHRPLVSSTGKRAALPIPAKPTRASLVPMKHEKRHRGGTAESPSHLRALRGLRCFSKNLSASISLRFEARPATLNPETGGISVCVLPTKTSSDLTSNSVGNTPPPTDYRKLTGSLHSLCTSDPAQFNCHQPLARSPAASAPFGGEPARDALPTSIHSQQVPASSRARWPAAAVSMFKRAELCVHPVTHPKPPTWDQKYRLIYIILGIKGTKRLTALHRGPGLHQHPEALIPTAALLCGAQRGTSLLPAHPGREPFLLPPLASSIHSGHPE